MGLGVREISTLAHAVEALARSARSTKDLARWLAQREHPAEEIEAAIAKLTARGMLNDAEYALAFTRSRALGRGMSRRRISAELFRRGVAKELVDAAINDVMSDENIDERAMVEAAGAKKFRSLSKLEPDVQRRRLYGFLARKGYPSDLVRDTVRKLAQ